MASELVSLSGGCLQVCRGGEGQPLATRGVLDCLSPGTPTTTWAASSTSQMTLVGSLAIPGLPAGRR